MGQEVPALGAILQGPPNATAIGIVGERAYWRFAAESAAGIATGSLAGGDATVIVPAIDALHAFDVSAHVVYQPSGGSVFAIAAGTTTPLEVRFQKEFFVEE